MTALALADALARAQARGKPLSRAQKRDKKSQLKPHSGLPKVSEAEIAEILASGARLEGLARSSPDLGLETVSSLKPLERGFRPSNAQIIRCGNQSRPTYPRQATKPFAKTDDPRLVDKHADIAQPHLGLCYSPEPRPPVPASPNTQHALSAFLIASEAICAEAAKTREQKAAQAAAAGHVAYLAGLMR